MRTVAVKTCDCGQENCFHSQTMILCVCAEDDEDKSLINGLTQELQTEAIHLPMEMINKLWREIEIETEIFKAGKELFSHFKIIG
jgi:hypothetical protein